MSASNRSHRRNNNNGSSVDTFQALQTVSSSNVPAPISHKRGRRKSRSPGGQALRPTEALNVVSKQKKKSASSLSALSISADDMSVDPGRKVKSRSLGIATQSRLSVENTNVPQRQTKKERDRSKSRDSQHHHRKHPQPQSEPVNRGSDSSPSGISDVLVLAAADYVRLEKEIDVLKKQAHDNKKTIKKHQKMIANLQLEELNAAETIKEKDSQISKLKSKSKKTEEVLSNIEANMFCQICMDLLFKPFALSPCGHILCAPCLQEWFRQAPPDDDDMEDDESPNYLLDRRKICPCCRAVVRHRPIPVFLVKSIATALAKLSKGPRRVSPPPEEDPWAGLFHPDDHPHGMDDDNDDDDEEGLELSDEYDSDEIFSYDDDDEPYDGPYVRAAWEPPNTVLDTDDYIDHPTAVQISLLRRGATLSMIDNYGMEYTHENGISAYLDESKIFLGWNISLSADDEDGHRYMNWIYGDVFDRPERWEVEMTGDSETFEARKLVRADEEVEEYSDTDSNDYD